MPEPYKRIVRYHFEACGEVIAITDIGDDFVCVEEARKNGQEDCHMSGVLSFNEACQFTWDEGESMFVRYHSQKLADAIREYLNTHGVPANA